MLYNINIIFSVAIMDLPSEIDSHAIVVIAGVETEEVEEVNDAYKDILEDIGKSIISTIAEAGSLCHR